MRVRKRQAMAAIADLGTNTSEVYLSSLSVSHFMYFAELEKKSKHDAHAFIKQFPALDVNQADVDWAFANDQGDFEDALQVACALRHGCKKFLTLDQGLKTRHHKHLAITLIR